jgi:hypothetical protein
MTRGLNCYYLFENPSLNCYYLFENPSVALAFFFLKLKNLSHHKALRRLLVYVYLNYFFYFLSLIFGLL